MTGVKVDESEESGFVPVDVQNALPMFISAKLERLINTTATSNKSISLPDPGCRSCDAHAGYEAWGHIGKSAWSVNELLSCKPG
jgi:hypothetical protein